MSIEHVSRVIHSKVVACVKEEAHAGSRRRMGCMVCFLVRTREVRVVMWGGFAQLGLEWSIRQIVLHDKRCNVVYHFTEPLLSLQVPRRRQQEQMIERRLAHYKLRAAAMSVDAFSVPRRRLHGIEDNWANDGRSYTYKPAFRDL